MDNLRVPLALREKLGSAAADALLNMFAEAHRLAVESFERRLDYNNTLLTERFERRLADLRADLLKWSFLFWIGQLAATAALLTGLLNLMLPGR